MLYHFLNHMQYHVCKGSHGRFGEPARPCMSLVVNKLRELFRIMASKAFGNLKHVTAGMKISLIHATKARLIGPAAWRLYQSGSILNGANQNMESFLTFKHTPPTACCKAGEMHSTEGVIRNGKWKSGA